MCGWLRVQPVQIEGERKPWEIEIDSYFDLIDTGELNLTSKTESQWIMSEIGESKYTSVCISVRNMAMWKCQKHELKLLKKVGIGNHGKW